MTFRDGQHVARRLRGAALAGLAAAVLAPAARADDPEPVVRSFDVVLAPVCLDGDFTCTIDDDGTPAAYALHLDTTVAGKLTGSLVVGLRTWTVTGTVSHGKKGTKASFTAVAGKDRLTFSGAVSGGALAGTVAGKGTELAGKHAFSIDVSSAPALTARVDCSLTDGPKGRITGSAQVTACGDVVPLTVSGTRGKKSLSLGFRAGKSFSFTGSGPADAADPLLSWSAHGFGAKATGRELPAPQLAAPTAPVYGASFYELETETDTASIVPTGGSAPHGAFSVSPALPAGLVFDATTAAITGIATEARATATYTVSAVNYSGTRSTTIDLRTRRPRAKSFDVETRTLTDDDLRHLLARTQFGVTNASLDRVRTQGADAYLDAILVFATNGPAEAVAAPELRNSTDPVGYEGRYPSATQVGRWWTSLMLNTDNPFQERMAFFWHDLFAASTEVLESPEMHFMTDYVNLFRAEGNGNLRQLLVKMARDPCMLKYLDGYRNTAARPNENFAREFWELFTLGVDQGYTQADIVQAARAFTGYRRTTVSVPIHQPPNDANDYASYTTMSFDRTLFDAGSKTIFGAYTIPAKNPATATDDYQEVVDVTLDHRPVAEFVTRRIFEHFGYASPPQELVDDMASYLRSQDYELRPFLKRLFRSEAFYSATARRNLVKNPVEFGVGFVHSTGLALQVSSFGNALVNLGQFPTQPPTVNGWPQGELWLSSQNMADRINLAYTCVEDTTRQRNVGIEVANILPPAGQRSADNVVDTLAALLRVTLTTSERQRCIDYVKTTVTGSSSAPVGTLNATFTLDGATQSVLDERVRGLLYILAQHPSYQVR